MVASTIEGPDIAGSSIQYQFNKMPATSPDDIRLVFTGSTNLDQVWTSEHQPFKEMKVDV
jgi:hypothetical protein